MPTQEKFRQLNYENQGGRQQNYGHEYDGRGRCQGGYSRGGVPKIKPLDTSKLEANTIAAYHYKKASKIHQIIHKDTSNN